MVYVLIGNECTGKTTIFEKLKRERALHPETSFIKESYTEDSRTKTFRARYFQSLINEGNPVIYDRATVIDELVYAPALDGKQSLFEGPFTSLLSRVGNGCIFIYLEADLNVLATRLDVRGDQWVAEDNLAAIQESYDRVLSALPLNVVRIDATASADEVYKKVLEVITNGESNAHR